MSAVKRRYHAPVREEQAAQTRQRIAAAAAVEFAEHGWSGSTVAAIAARARLTPQAVHLAVGGKAALLVRAVEVTVAGATDDELLASRPAFADVYAPRVPASRRWSARRRALAWAASSAAAASLAAATWRTRNRRAARP